MSLIKSDVIKILAAVRLLALYGLPVYAHTAEFERVYIEQPWAERRNTERLVQA